MAIVTLLKKNNMNNLKDAMAVINSLHVSTIVSEEIIKNELVTNAVLQITGFENIKKFVSIWQGDNLQRTMNTYLLTN